MNLTNIERLEEKINQIILQVKSQKEKNDVLISENAELKSMLDDRNKLIQNLETQLSQMKQQTLETDLFRENEEKVKEKISSMLEKLDQLEAIL